MPQSAYLPVLEEMIYDVPDAKRGTFVRKFSFFEDTPGMFGVSESRMVYKYQCPHST
jgi:hypothetical protein